MTVADTSFLVAFFDRDDPRHGQTRQAFAETMRVLIYTEVLVETLGVIKAKAGRSAAQAALEDLVRLANVEWVQESDVPATYRTYREEKALSFVDAAVVHHCLRLGLEPLTYDDAQLRAVKRGQGRRTA